MKPAPKTGPDLPGESASQDPEFNDAMPGGVIDPAHQDFRDTMDVADALGQHGVVQGIDAELKEQQRQVESDTLEVLEALRSLDAGETVSWRITRRGTGNPELDGFLDTWPSALLTLERIRDLMGGGTFYLKGFRNGKYWVHKTVTIAGIPKLYVKDEAGRVSTQQTPNPSSFDVQGFLVQQAARDAQVRRENEEKEDRVRREREEREERERARWERTLSLVLPVVGTLGSALVTAFAGRQDNTAALIAAVKGPDPLAVLAQLKALEDKPNHDGLLLKVLPMLLEKASDGAREGDTGWLDVVKELAKSAGPAVGTMIEAAMTQARQNGLPPAGPSMTVTQVPSNGSPMGSLPQPTPNPNPTDSTGLIVVPESRPRRERRARLANDPSGVAAPPVGVTGDTVSTAGASLPGTIPGGSNMNLFALMQHIPWIKEQLARMGPAAARGRDPEVYAALFLEELPEGITPEVLGGLLSRNDWFQQLAQLDPRIDSSELYPWFEVLRTHILRSLTQETQHVAPGPAGVSPAVAGPGNGAPVQPAGSAPTRAHTGDIQRPTKIPSLTGEVE